MGELVAKEIPEGLSPYTPDAPMRAFVALLRCERAGCKAPLQILAIRNVDTSAEELEKEKAEWWWENLTCPNGHPIPDRLKKG